MYIVQGPRGEGAEDLTDPLVMSFFLAVPIASLLWAVTCFLFAIAATAVQSSSKSSSVVLLVVLGAVAFIGGTTLVSSGLGGLRRRRRSAKLRR